MLLPEHYGVPLRLHILNSSAFVYSDRDVTTNYRNPFISKPLCAKCSADFYDASISRSFWTSYDIYNSLSNLHWFDKLFFVWNFFTHRFDYLWYDIAQAVESDELSPSVLL